MKGTRKVSFILGRKEGRKTMRNWLMKMGVKKTPKQDVRYFVGGENYTDKITSQDKITNIEIYTIFNTMNRQLTHILTKKLSEEDRLKCQELQAKLQVLRAIQESYIQQEDYYAVFETYTTLFGVLREIYMESDTSGLYLAEQIEALSLLDIIYSGYEKFLKVEEKRQEIDRLVIMQRIQTERGVWESVTANMQTVTQEQTVKLKMLEEIQKNLYEQAHNAMKKQEQDKKEVPETYQQELQEVYQEELDYLQQVISMEQVEGLQGKAKQQELEAMYHQYQKTLHVRYMEIKKKVYRQVKDLIETSIQALQDTTLLHTYKEPKKHLQKLQQYLEELEAVKVDKVSDPMCRNGFDKILEKLYQTYNENVISPIQEIQTYEVDTQNHVGKKRFNEFSTPILYRELDRYVEVEKLYYTYNQKREELLQQRSEILTYKELQKKQQQLECNLQRTYMEHLVHLRNYKQKQQEENLEVNGRGESNLKSYQKKLMQIRGTEADRTKLLQIEKRI